MRRRRTVAEASESRSRAERKTWFSKVLAFGVRRRVRKRNLSDLGCFSTF